MKIQTELPVAQVEALEYGVLVTLENQWFLSEGSHVKTVTFVCEPNEQPKVKDFVTVWVEWGAERDERQNREAAMVQIMITSTAEESK